MTLPLTLLESVLFVLAPTVDSLPELQPEKYNWHDDDRDEYANELTGLRIVDLHDRCNNHKSVETALERESDEPVPETDRIPILYTRIYIVSTMEPYNVGKNSSMLTYHLYATKAAIEGLSKNSKLKL